MAEAKEPFAPANPSNWRIETIIATGFPRRVSSTGGPTSTPCTTFARRFRASAIERLFVRGFSR
jgi:hypothetical protein